MCKSCYTTDKKVNNFHKSHLIKEKNTFELKDLDTNENAIPVAFDLTKFNLYDHNNITNEQWKVR